MEKSTLDEGSEGAFHNLDADHQILFVWTPECELGIPIIDEQHRGIITTINSLYYAVYHNLGEHMIMPVVGMVNEYTRIHFEVEEKFLAEYKYPDLASHRDLHYKLVQRMSDTGRESMLHHDPYPFLDFLKDWWRNHIGVEDRKFRVYIEDSGKPGIV